MYTTNTLHHPQLLRTLPFSPSLKSSNHKSSPFYIRPVIRSSIDGQGGENANRASVPASLDITPEEIVERRLRRSSRRKKKMQSFYNETPKTSAKAEPAAPKRWEEMSISEKILEVYVGEKGLLFWLNKFAYASIFIVIGGWILFRFVGPSLNLYQLDSPPLSPDSMFKGSP